MEENKDIKNAFTERRINDNISPDALYLGTEI